MRIVKLEENAKKNILSNLLKRDLSSYGSHAGMVQQIIDDVKERQDAVVFEYTAKFDGAAFNASNMRVAEAKIEEAVGLVEPSLLEVMKKSMKGTQNYHQKQVQHSWFDSKPGGTILGQRATALESAGAYVPGGKMVYPSFVLMNIILVGVTGVERIVMVTPPGKDGKVNPVTLTTAHLMGVTKAYRVDGAQVVAVLASGTESIPRVSKTVGPGNVLVALTKKVVYGHTSIDNIAGPGEILALTDETANPRFVAADLLSQTEHDELALAILVMTSMELTEKMSAQVDEFVKELSRKEILEKSLENLRYILVAGNMEDVIDTANEIASEYLKIMMENPFETMTKIQNTGVISIREYSSEPLSDYLAGPNHMLPTNRTVKFFPLLGADGFIKKSSIIYYLGEVLEPVRKGIIAFAKTEQLTAHANSIRVKLEE